jgi:hypothetical protein
MPNKVDNDPTVLAARTLIERLRGTEYEDGDAPMLFPRWWRYRLSDDEAIEAVLAFLNRSGQATVQPTRGGSAVSPGDSA